MNMRKQAVIYALLWFSSFTTCCLWCFIVSKQSFFAHALTLYIMMVGITSIYIARKHSTFLFNYLTLSLTAPICGWLIALVFLRAHKTIPATPEHIHFKHLSYQVSYLTNKHLSYGAGGLTQLLFNESSDIEKRLKALSLLHHHKRPEFNLILQRLLFDKNDSIRIVAFKSLENQQNQLLSRLENLAQHRDTHRESMAELYWERLYLHLCPKELKRQTVTEIYKQFEYDNKSAYGCFLKGKCALLDNQLDDALSYFHKASKHQQIARKALPFIADIYFRHRSYDKVKKLLQNHDGFHHSKIATVSSLWQET